MLIRSDRGYGLSEGTPNEDGIRLDSRAALKFIKERSELKPTKLVLYGQSIGSAVALELASTEQQVVSGIIIENGFTGLVRWSLVVDADMAARAHPSRAAAHQAVPLPAARALAVYRHHRQGALLCPDTSLSQQITVPILFLSGARDELVPPAHMRALFDKCSSKRKRFVSLPQGTHSASTDHTTMHRS